MENNLLAIVYLEQDNGNKVFVISDDYDPKIFGGVEEIEAVRKGHVLENATWWAFDLDTGYTDVVL